MSAHPFLSLLIALGLAAAWALAATRIAPKLHRWWYAYNVRRLAYRLERGEDRYFEERRSIESALERPYAAHGFGWHFIRACLVLMIAFAPSISPLFSE